MSTWEDVYIREGAKVFVAILLNPFKFWDAVFEEMNK
jgi:hypothetical protein